LDALAAEGIVFDNHISDCPDGSGAWRAWRTGRYDFPRPGIPSASHPPGSSDVLSLLRTRDIPSWLLFDSPVTQGANGGSYWEEFRLIQGKESPGMLSRIVMKFMRQLKWLDHGMIWVQPDFLFPSWPIDQSNADYFSGHAADDDESQVTPIEPLPDPELGLLDPSDESTFERLQRTYAAAVTLLDCELQKLWDQLRQEDFYDSLMIIVTTDRGFPLGEHGLVGESRPWLHEELVHLPLIIRLPHRVGAGGRIGALTQPVDLMATLLEAFDLPSVDCHGSSLLPLIRGEQERIRDFACSGLEKGGEVEYGLRTRDWAFLLPEQSGGAHEMSRVLPRNRQLYVKPDDRWEVNSVMQHETEVAEVLEQTLRAFIKAPSLDGQRFASTGMTPRNSNS
jgi:hypothetical protein